MRFRFRLVLALCCPLIVVGVDAQTEPSEAVKTSLCELAKAPAQFNGKLVQVRATVFLGFESSQLIDENCSARVWLAGPRTTYLTIGHTPLPDEPPVQIENDAEYRKMADYLRTEYQPKGGSRCVSCPLYKVVATVKGRFDHVNKEGLDARARFLIGFGHLNTYDSQVFLQSVSDVVAYPVDPSRYDQSTITGTVMDATGAVIVNATAKLYRRGQKDIAAQASTDASGNFRFSQLREDTYDLEIEAPGFRSQRLKQIVVGWASEVRLKPVKLKNLGIVFDNPPGGD
jgi:hypothetical protein